MIYPRTKLLVDKIRFTWYCTHTELHGFYSYYIHQGNKLDKERKIARKKLSFMHRKRFNIFFYMGAIPCGYNFTSTIKSILSYF